MQRACSQSAPEGTNTSLIPAETLQKRTSLRFRKTTLLDESIGEGYRKRQRSQIAQCAGDVGEWNASWHVVHLDMGAKTRSCGAHRKREGQAKIKKPTSEKESQKWLDCVKHVGFTLFPSDVKLLFIQDREADIFDLFLEPRRPGTDLLVRAAQARRVQTETDDPDGGAVISTLFKSVRSTEVQVVQPQ